MMSFIEAISASFPRDIRQRGEDYFSSGAVRFQTVGPLSATAMVQGTHCYKVQLDWQKGQVSSSCTCPLFSPQTPCKHIWATLLAVDEQGSFNEATTGWSAGPYSPAVDGGNGDDKARLGDNPASAVLRPVQDGMAHVVPMVRKSSDSLFKLEYQPSWKHLLDSMSQVQRHDLDPEGQDNQRWPAQEQLLYVVDVPSSKLGKGLVIEIVGRRPKPEGQWGKARTRAVAIRHLAKLQDPADRKILQTLVGARTDEYHYYAMDSANSRFVLHDVLRDDLLPQMCRTGRLRLCGNGVAVDAAPSSALQLDEGEPWQHRLEFRAEGPDNYVLRGVLCRGSSRENLTGPSLLVAGGWVFWPTTVARLDDSGETAFQWINLLRREKEVRVPAAQVEDMLSELLTVDNLPPLDLPTELRFEQSQGAAQPCLHIRKPDTHYGNELAADLSFDYGGKRIAADHGGRGIFIPEKRCLYWRDRAAEARAHGRLEELGFHPGRYGTKENYLLTTKHLMRAVSALLGENWHVEAEGNVYRRAVGDLSLTVATGIDWFELRGEADFGGQKIALPRLLTALRKGENVIRLDDGTVGLLPEEWLKKYGLLAKVGQAQDDHLRFARTQTGVLDALLAAEPAVSFDEAFGKAREELRRFGAIESVTEPQGFVGELRLYQRDGLGWLLFLQRFGFGGCLADDMGLGKTVQVLALLETRRQLRAAEGPADRKPGPSLAVVPRSLIFNWRQEGQKFTPALRVLDHTGTLRQRETVSHFANYDLILTTYGTLRRDIVHLKKVAFDYIILDEAQSVKNASSASAKAVRLLRGSHRLCLSGTPIENHLGELWSQFEFLNPGMLGASGLLTATTHSEQADQARLLLAKALRPYILRRTKDQVAKDLPPKTEQTVFCQLEGPQRQHYDELRAHYRQALLGRVDREGLAKSKIQILEALLRLRQVACHPGLVDPARAGESSAKLEALLPQLTQVMEEGHKALVFSQFTKLLGIVRKRLDAQGIVYEYLDGKTRDRQERVERFQTDPLCKLFLVSLKAGGLGLNLTAAEYVFLLDPWWNPAVEAQAIDRAHRIGQQSHVFAYRLIARDTVEEKVLELQKSKRELADAIINADNSLIRSLRREDLELLLG